jgi:uncharacterized protein (TIGR02301 family)
LTSFGKRLALAALIALAPGIAIGQGVNEVAPVAPPPAEVQPAPPPVAELPPAYEEQMLRLAEILGSLHYLRELCGAEEGQTWRQEMEKLLQAEQPAEARKQRLVARFNRGYRSFREIYRDCTPSAAEAANRYLRQGVRIASEIPGRYGN